MNVCPRLTEKGIARVEAHLARAELEALDDPLNSTMIARLKLGIRTMEDLNFYTHELKESALMTGGLGAREAHLATLQWQGISYVRGYEARLYAPEAYRLLNPHS